MDLQETMKQKVFVVVGNTENEEKYAYLIKKGLLAKDYTVYCVPKEYESINDVPGDIDVIDLCIHPVKGIKLLTECTKDYKNVVIQPGAESEEILEFLKEGKKPFTESCLLVGLSVYR